MELKNKKIFIAGLARDCEKNLPMVIKLVEELRIYFADSYVYIVENDSKDSTKEILQKWQTSNVNVSINSQDYGSLTIPKATKFNSSPLTSQERISKMTKYRNIYLDFFKNSLNNFDYILIIDMDICGFSVQGVIEALINAPKDWGAIFANGASSFRFLGKSIFPIFYDTYAFLGTNENLNIHVQSAKRRRRLQRLLSIILPRKKYYQCISSFSGMALYRTEVITPELQYICMKNKSQLNHEALCEHIPFNNNIAKNGYKSYISNKMIVRYGSYNIKFLIDFLLFNIPSRILKKV